MFQKTLQRVLWKKWLGFDPNNHDLFAVKMDYIELNYLQSFQFSGQLKDTENRTGRRQLAPKQYTHTHLNN